MVESKRTSSRNERNPVNVTAKDIPGVPKGAERSLNMLLGDLKAFPTLLARSSTFPREDNRLTDADRKLMRPVLGMPIFNSDDPLLTPVYSALTEQMKSKNVSQAHLAFVVAYVAIDQMSSPFEKTYSYKNSVEEEQSAARQVRNACHDRPVKPDIKPLRRMRKAMIDYCQKLTKLPKQQPETGFFQSAIVSTQLSQLVTSELYASLRGIIEPPMHAALSKGLAQWRENMFRDSYASAVLFEGRMPWLETPMQLGILLNHQKKLLEKPADPSQFDASCQFFLQNKAVQQEFWRNMQKPNDERTIIVSSEYRHATIPAFGRDQETFQHFLATVPDDIRADKKLFGRAITELVYLMTLAKGQGQDTDIVTLVLAKAAAGATPRSLVEPVFAIATDSKPGVLFRTDNGTVAGALWYQEQQSPKKKIDPDKVLYESTAKSPPVIMREAASPVFVREERPQIETAGVMTSPYWGELQTLGKDAQGQLLVHMGKKLIIDPMQQERLLGLAVQDRSPEALSHAMVVLPILDEDHPLGALRKAGIMSIERKGTDLSLIVSQIAAGVESASPEDIIITGAVTIDGDVHLSSGLSISAHLDTALTAAVNLTYQTPTLPESSGKMAQRKDRFVQRLREWNGNNQNPHVIADRPSESDCGVIIPLSATDGFIYTMLPQVTR